YEWNFGDNTPTIKSKNPEYIYQKPGTYQVTFTVSDHEHTILSTTTTVTVEAEQTPIEEAEIIDVKSGLLLSVTIATGDIPVHWSMNIDGKILLGKTETTGDLSEYTIATIKTNLLIGFGPIDIIITMNDKTEKYHAFLIGPFILNTQEV
ncbi:MAG: PKD domain-containing protein, partial [Candidatus Thermoplasmatota archaeon]|nr:PKD domain-containing protein [Candidatus Thermoplasmatota archaeon]